MLKLCENRILFGRTLCVFEIIFLSLHSQMWQRSFLLINSTLWRNYLVVRKGTICHSSTSVPLFRLCGTKLDRTESSVVWCKVWRQHYWQLWKKEWQKHTKKGMSEVIAYWITKWTKSESEKLKDTRKIPAGISKKIEMWKIDLRQSHNHDLAGTLNYADWTIASRQSI